MLTEQISQSAMGHARRILCGLFFFNDTATTEIYTLSLHDALPILIGWLDLSAGASGDMLLGALVDAGVPLEVLADAVAALPVERMLLTAEPDARHGLGGTRVHVHAPESGVHRTWADVRGILADADLDDAVREGALAVFERLALAEGR